MNSTKASELRLGYCDHKAALYAVKNWHYTASLPTPPIVKIGVWEDDVFIGVVLFSRGASKHLGKPYGLANTQVCELTRVALTRHKTPVSKIIKTAILLLRKTSPLLRLIVSFADSNRNHHGGIYQAGNWTYAGKTSDTVEYRDKNGRQWHKRQVSKTEFQEVYGAIRRAPRFSCLQKVRMQGKHRYLMPLDAAMTTQIALLRQPYPKREGVNAAVG